jgi:ABC-type antimicrobial peptide transport system permease subunit
LGLVLALVGIYGVVSYSVSRRTQEFGIRIALGASRAEVLSLALRQGLRVVLAGVLLGLLASWAATRAISKLLIGVSASDPWSYAVVSLALSAVALLACWLPARRALKVEPMVALRHE